MEVLSAVMASSSVGWMSQRHSVSFIVSLNNLEFSVFSTPQCVVVRHIVIQDPQVEDPILSTNVKDGVEGTHVKFLQVFTVMYHCYKVQATQI